jgi:hypothetical protein
MYAAAYRRVRASCTSVGPYQGQVINTDEANGCKVLAVPLALPETASIRTHIQLSSPESRVQLSF